MKKIKFFIKFTQYSNLMTVSWDRFGPMTMILLNLVYYSYTCISNFNDVASKTKTVKVNKGHMKVKAKVKYMETKFSFEIILDFKLSLFVFIKLVILGRGQDSL